MRNAHMPGTYKAYRFLDEGWLILFKDEQGQLRLVDDAKVQVKQAAWRKARRLNEEGNAMKKIVAEWVVEQKEFIETVETRYMENGERTRSRAAVPKWEKEKLERELKRQLEGETETESYDKMNLEERKKATSSVVEERLRNR